MVFSFLAGVVVGVVYYRYLQPYVAKFVGSFTSPADPSDNGGE